jgi:hypothetical protein
MQRSARKWLLIGLAGLALGGLVLLLVDEEILPLSRVTARLGGTLLGGGGVATIAGLVVAARGAIAAAPEGRRAALRRWIVAAALLVPAAAAFSTYSLGFHWKETRALCWSADMEPDLERRRHDLAEAEARLRSPFSWLPELVGFRVSRDCARARADLERLEAGECPTNLLPGAPCRCGAARWPEDARCQHPQCVGQPRVLRCP